jgi:hypothetical protein
MEVVQKMLAAVDKAAPLDLFFGGMGLLVIGLVVGSLVLAHFREACPIDLFDLLKTDGKADPVKFAFMLAIIVSSYVLMHLLFSGKLTEGYYIGFLTAWVAALMTAIMKGHGKPDDTPPPPKGG